MLVESRTLHIVATAVPSASAGSVSCLVDDHNTVPNTSCLGTHPVGLATEELTPRIVVLRAVVHVSSFCAPRLRVANKRRQILKAHSPICRVSLL